MAVPTNILIPSQCNQHYLTLTVPLCNVCSRSDALPSNHPIKRFCTIALPTSPQQQVRYPFHDAPNETIKVGLGVLHRQHLQSQHKSCIKHLAVCVTPCALLACKHSHSPCDVLRLSPLHLWLTLPCCRAPFHCSTLQRPLIRRARIWDGEDWKYIQPGLTWHDGEVSGQQAAAARKHVSLGHYVHGVHGLRVQSMCRVVKPWFMMLKRSVFKPRAVVIC